MPNPGQPPPRGNEPVVEGEVGYASNPPMNCERARELLEKHISYLTTGKEKPTSNDVPSACNHVRKCNKGPCEWLWNELYGFTLRLRWLKQNAEKVESLRNAAKYPSMPGV